MSREQQVWQPIYGKEMPKEMQVDKMWDYYYFANLWAALLSH